MNLVWGVGSCAFLCYVGCFLVGLELFSERVYEFIVSGSG